MKEETVGGAQGQETVGGAQGQETVGRTQGQETVGRTQGQETVERRSREKADREEEAEDFELTQRSCFCKNTKLSQRNRLVS